MKPLTAARVTGAVLLFVAVAIGFVAGRWSVRSEPGRFTVLATDALPEELVQLGITRDQREALRPVLSRGRERVLRVVDSFAPQMKGAMDSTDMEIRGVLTELQRAAFDSLRRAKPSLRKVIRP